RDVGLVVAREGDVGDAVGSDDDGQFAVGTRLAPHTRAVHRRLPGRAQIRPSSDTASRSSPSSATLASMRPRAKSLTSRPGTIFHWPFSVVHGKPEMSPSGTP